MPLRVLLGVNKLPKIFTFFIIIGLGIFSLLLDSISRWSLLFDSFFPTPCGKMGCYFFLQGKRFGMFIYVHIYISISIYHINGNVILIFVLSIFIFH